jgi:hypothetical protein
LAARDTTSNPGATANPGLDESERMTSTGSPIANNVIKIAYQQIGNKGGSTDNRGGTIEQYFTETGYGLGGP